MRCSWSAIGRRGERRRRGCRAGCGRRAGRRRPAGGRPRRARTPRRRPARARRRRAAARAGGCRRRGRRPSQPPTSPERYARTAAARAPRTPALCHRIRASADVAVSLTARGPDDLQVLGDRARWPSTSVGPALWVAMARWVAPRAAQRWQWVRQRSGSPPAYWAWAWMAKPSIERPAASAAARIVSSIARRTCRWGCRAASSRRRGGRSARGRRGAEPPNQIGIGSLGRGLMPARSMVWNSPSKLERVLGPQPPHQLDLLGLATAAGREVVVERRRTRPRSSRCRRRAAAGCRTARRPRRLAWRRARPGAAGRIITQLTNSSVGGARRRRRRRTSAARGRRRPCRRRREPARAIAIGAEHVVVGEQVGDAELLQPLEVVRRWRRDRCRSRCAGGRRRTSGRSCTDCVAPATRRRTMRQDARHARPDRRRRAGAGGQRSAGSARRLPGSSIELRAMGVDVDVVIPDYAPAAWCSPARCGDGSPCRRGRPRRRCGSAITRSPVASTSWRCRAWRARTRTCSPTAMDGRTTTRGSSRFSRAVAAMVRAAPPDVLHLNDWHTGAVLAALTEPPPTVVSIHNLAYQGVDRRVVAAPARSARPALRVVGRHEPARRRHRPGRRVVAVSPHYAAEILTPEAGSGSTCRCAHRGDALIGHPQRHRHRRCGTRATDRHIAVAATTRDRRSTAKAPNRARAARALRLSPTTTCRSPSMVTRLTDQKGVDLLAAARAAARADPDAPRRARLGRRAAGRRRSCRGWPRHPDWFAFVEGYDEALGAPDVRRRRPVRDAEPLRAVRARRRCRRCATARSRSSPASAVSSTPCPTSTPTAATGSGFVAADGRRRSICWSALFRAGRRIADRRRRAPLQRRGMAVDWSWRRPASRVHRPVRTAARARRRLTLGGIGLMAEPGSRHRAGRRRGQAAAAADERPGQAGGAVRRLATA